MHMTFWGSGSKVFMPLIGELLQAGGNVVSEDSSDADAIVVSEDAFDLTRLPQSGRIVLLSSIRVYQSAAQAEKAATGEPTTAPQNEASALRTDVAVKLVQMEAALRQSGRAWVIVRLPQVFGPGTPKIFGKYLGQMANKRPALLLEPAQANWRYTHGYVADIAAAIALAATHDKAAGQIYNLGEREAPTIAERLHLLARAAGYKGKILVVPDRLAPEHLKDKTTDYRNDVILDTGRIRRELGYTETTSEKQVWQQTVAWESAELQPTIMSVEQSSAEDEVLRKFGLLSRK